MFDEFVKPELKKTIDHLYGVGQLNHLDSLLSIKKLDGIQWVPGDGQPDIINWPEVFKKIIDSDKLIQFFNHQYKGDSFELLDIIIDQTGCSENILYILDIEQKDRDKAEKMLCKYGF